MIQKVQLSKVDSNHLKAFGILLVIFCHVGGMYTRLVTPLGGIGVAIFLFLSGFGLTKSSDKKGLKDYWKKRIIAVVVPYLMVETIVVLINVISPFTSEHRNSIIGYLLDISLIFPTYKYGWYLNFLLLMYVVYWLCYFLSEKFNWNLVNMVFICSCVIGIFYGVMGDGLRFEQAFCFFFGVFFARRTSRTSTASTDKSTKYITKGIILLGIALFAILIKQLPIIRGLSIYFSNGLDLIVKHAALLGMIYIYIYISTKM